MDALINEVSTWLGYEQYAEKLKALKPTFIEDTIKCYECNEPDDVGTLVHGDLWLNNVMFKYDENQCPIDALIVRFLEDGWSIVSKVNYCLFSLTFSSRATARRSSTSYTCFSHPQRMRSSRPNRMSCSSSTTMSLSRT
jgi:Ecdysteroid kinase-like family